MSNLRLIHDNAADRATIVASSTAGSLGVQYLKTDRKGEVHRSVGTSVTYTLTWPTAVSIGGVGLPATNLTSAGTVRVRGYDADDNLVADSGVKPAAPGPNLGAWPWIGPLGGNAFAYGGATKSALWFLPQIGVRKLVLDLADPSNPAGYIDCARIVAGSYWEAQYNAAYGSTVAVVDTTTVTRADSGDAVPDLGTQHDAMTLDLSVLRPDDRARVMQILRGNGVGRPVFLCVVPSNGDPLLVQDWTMYGRLSNTSLTFASYNLHTAQLQIEGW
ncbi:hypothetical protein [Xenophilus sp. Marseille-Q4582]|uniref:hypothetical protein n=1 Tax=Xenophilus sp. Marseille-Q4582 TaxID=2866600 RepID=UPI001CE42C1F|nr:hypothetical protein [Xenophilus sp. Marseille-Q4582]